MSLRVIISKGKAANGKGLGPLPRLPEVVYHLVMSAEYGRGLVGFVLLKSSKSTYVRFHQL